MRQENPMPLRATIVAVCVVGALCIARPSWAGPHLTMIAEFSSAQSQRECGSQVGHVLRRMEREKRLDGVRDDGLAWTRESTIYIECIFVGQTEARRNQWIFQVAIASTDEAEFKRLLSQIRTELKKRPGRIDGGDSI